MKHVDGGSFYSFGWLCGIHDRSVFFRIQLPGSDSAPVLRRPTDSLRIERRLPDGAGDLGRSAWGLHSRPPA